jgi:hypothetical protein
MWPVRIWISTLICLTIEIFCGFAEVGAREFGVDFWEAFKSCEAFPPFLVSFFGLFFEVLYGC